jgi:hypothetical protein
MLLGDQRALDGLVFVRRLAGRLQREELEGSSVRAVPLLGAQT